jgi:hypothetical protein
LPVRVSSIVVVASQFGQSTIPPSDALQAQRIHRAFES